MAEESDRRSPLLNRAVTNALNLLPKPVGLALYQWPTTAHIMNLTLHFVQKVHLLPSDLGGRKDGVASLYCLEAIYKPGANPRGLPLVHVPKSLLPYFQEGCVEGFHLETLTFNSHASRGLPGLPLHAVVSVRHTDGGECVEMPKQWRYSRNRLLWLGGVIDL